MNKASNEKISSNVGESILILTESPVGIEFGIDCITYETGPKFRGLTMVPTGLHFIFYGTGMGARQGYFLNIVGNQVVVNSWDASNEQILPFHHLSTESLNSLFAALQRGDLNSELGPYPLHQHHLWKNNSSYISEQVLATAQCAPGTLLFPGDETAIFGDSSNLLAGNATGAPVVSAGANHDASKPYFRDLASTACFVDLEGEEAALLEAVPRNALRPATLTRMMLDKSPLLERLIATTYGGSFENLLGELQLSYMLFMLLYSYPALQHWKRLVSIVCSAETFLAKHAAFTAAFMKVFYNQLSFSPVDFFESELSKDNFLRPVITALFSSLEGTGSGAPVDEHLQEHQRRLFLFLRKKFNLFGDRDDGDSIPSGDYSAAMRGGSVGQGQGEQDEDGPVVVSQEEIRALQRYSSGGAAEEGDAAMEGVEGEDQSAAMVQASTEITSCAAERWSEIDRLLLTSQPAHSLNCNVIPMPIALRSAVSVSIAVPTAPMSPAQMEAAMFGWRYPLLFESMLRSQGREDLTMAAARILDQHSSGEEHEEGDLTDGRTAVGRLAEAQRYLEDEVARRAV